MTNTEDTFHINQFTIVHHLLTPNDNQNLITQDPAMKALLPSEFLPNLENPSRWHQFKESITSEIQDRQNYDDLLNQKQIRATQLTQFDGPDAKTIAQDRVFTQSKIAEAQKKLQIIHLIDDLLANTALQELLLAREELAEVKKNADVSTVQRQDLETTVAALEKHVAHGHSHHESLIAELAETNVEVASTSSESKLIIAEKVHQLQELHQMTEASTQSSDTVQTLSPAGEFFHSMPLVNNFVRGLIQFREANEAFNNPATPQRRTKIAAGIFGSVLSIGVGITGALALAGVGLLAGAAAVLAFPIVAAAVITGVYGIALYRDHYIVQETAKSLDKAQQAVTTNRHDFAREVEIVLSTTTREMVSDSPSLIKVKNIQAEIDLQRHHLHDAITLNSSAEIIEPLKHRIHDLCQTRNQKIKENKDLSIRIRTRLQNDPRLSRLSLRQHTLSGSVTVLKKQLVEAKKNRFWSALGVIGVGLALAAVCATGIGAIVLCAAAATVIASAAIIKGVTAYKRNEAAKEAAKHAPAHPPLLTAHSSLLDIDKTLVHGQQYEIAKALIKEKQSVIDAAAKEKAANAAKPFQGTVAAAQSQLNETRTKKNSDSPHNHP